MPETTPKQQQQPEQQPENGQEQTSHLPTPQYKTLPYGEQQGTFCGVAACSNRDDGFFSGEKNYVNHLIFTGFRYQCVEYARRFLLLTTGCVFAECGRASEVFKMRQLTHVETGKTYPLVPHDNGVATRKPEPGDVIIYPFDDHMCPWGHIGIISYADDHKIGIAEQNQYFGSFVSPCADYRDGERCVGRFVDLEQNAETGAWTIKEGATMPSPKGWMSYLGTPRREHIFAEFNPLPQFVAVRRTPLEDKGHPFVYHVRMPAPLDIPSTAAPLADAYGLVSGSGESGVGAISAASRVIRFTLQTLFRRAHIGSAFLSLPTNPLKAEIKPCAALDRLFGELARQGSAADSEAALVPALAEYFGLPPQWIAAMQKEFAKGELHVFADFSLGLHAHEPDVRRDPLRTTPPPTAATNANHATKNMSEKKGTDEEEDDDEAGTCPPPHKIRVENPYDEAWQLLVTDFGTCNLMVEIPQLASVMDRVKGSIEFQLPGFRCFGMPGYSYDFGNYLKHVEERRGPRTAFTIVLDSEARMDGPRREMVTLLQSYCEKIKYPVRVVAERDLFYDEAIGKLHARISEASPPIASPTSIAPLGDFEVNFVFQLCEWEEILKGNGTRDCPHKALFHAAVDHEKSDVVFAKPLWSHLVSGRVHRSSAELGSPTTTTLCEPKNHAKQPLSIKFFDIARRLFAYAMPRQAAETWDQEVSEYKDSCRRIGLVRKMAEEPPAGFVSSVAVVDFAISAFMAHTGVELLKKSANGRIPAALMHVFSTANES